MANIPAWSPTRAIPTAQAAPMVSPVSAARTTPTARIQSSARTMTKPQSTLGLQPTDRYRQLPQALGSKIADQLISQGMLSEIDQVVAAKLAAHYKRISAVSAASSAPTGQMISAVSPIPTAPIGHKKRSGVWLFLAALWFALPAGMIVGSGWKPWAFASDPLPVPKPSPTLAAVIPSTKPLKITVTLSDPSDLLVKEGQVVKEGQMLAARTREQARLNLQKQGMIASIKQLSIPAAPPIQPPPPRQMPELPEVSFAEEAARIDQAQGKVTDIERQISLQERKIDALRTLDPGSLPPAVAEREELELAKLRDSLETAKVDFRLSQAQLERAQETRKQQQYNHELDLANQETTYAQSRATFEKTMADYQASEQQRTIALANLREKVAAIDAQLQSLSTVRSPYNGTIRRVKFTGQSNNELSAELTLAIASSSPGQVTPAAPTSNGGNSGNTTTDQLLTNPDPANTP